MRCAYKGRGESGMGAISHPQTLTTHLALLAGDGYVLMRCVRTGLEG
jgi:hypothetical protein